jgi:hypothetical protein
MDRYVRAIPREKREDDVAREQQRSKHAIRDASVEAAGLKRGAEDTFGTQIQCISPRTEKEQQQNKHAFFSLHDFSSGCNNVLAHCGLRNAQVPAQCWYL